MFSFLGFIPASKSLMNRALVAQSFFPHLKVMGVTESDDVRSMQEGLKKLSRTPAREVMGPIDCGHAGTVLRFLALAASRRPGTSIFFGSERLFSRPQKELHQVLLQLGVDVRIESQRLILKSNGWRVQGDALHVPCGRSSQFASAVLLSSWNLPHALHVSLSGRMVSQSYWKMTVDLLRTLGLTVFEQGPEITVPPKQSVQASEYFVEPDMSSAFAVAAMAAVGGEATLLEFPQKSSQPDFVFVELLSQMGALVSHKDHQLNIKKTKTLQGLKVNLRNAPDLFPVLAALAATAEGPSQFYGAKHLAYKESNRISKVAELIQKAGRPVKINEDGLDIGEKFSSDKKTPFSYDSDQDHRLVMAAAILQQAGWTIDLHHPEAVTKSFPEFLAWVKSA